MPTPSLPDLGTALKTAPRIECRVRPRHACNLEASCQPVAARGDDDLHWHGTICDISAGGVGLILKHRFVPGTELVIELRAGADYPEQTLLARVRHATPLPAGHWLLGCAFLSELRDDEVQSLLRLAAGPQPPARKVGDSRPTVPAVTEVTFRGLAEDGRPLAILVKRLQPSPTWPLAAGTGLALRVGGANAAQVRLVVLETSRAPGGWLVRCRFLGAPRAEVATALGRPGLA
jgi:hypothetical protein